MILPGLAWENGARSIGGTGDQPLKRGDTGTLWHLVFFSVSDYPEKLLVGRERLFLDAVDEECDVGSDCVDAGGY